MAEQDLPGVRKSPNIWDSPDVYERQNLGVDPDGAIESAMAEIADWSGAHVLDVGCGAGFHLPRFAQTAGLVTGVEPHPPLVERASRRVAALPQPQRDRITVQQGSAEALPLPGWSEAERPVDVAHARWAYFFGPGCEPGLAELARVIRPGGVAFIIDNDATRSTFGEWFRQAWPEWDPVANERFWTRRGFTRRQVDMRWDFPDRETLESVVRIEFRPETAADILRRYDGHGVDYAVNLWWRRYGPS